MNCFQDCPRCFDELYKELTNAAQQLSTISLAMCSGLSDERIPGSRSANGPIDVEAADLSRCESEEQILDTANKIGLYIYICTENKIMFG